MRKEHDQAQPVTATQTNLRRLEWFTVALGLLVHSGALFPLFMMGADGHLDDAERAKLRLLYLPVYALSFALIAARPKRVLVAIMQNVPMLLCCSCRSFQRFGRSAPRSV